MVRDECVLFTAIDIFHRALQCMQRPGNNQTGTQISIIPQQDAYDATGRRAWGVFTIADS